MSAINLPAICNAHNFTLVEVGYTTNEGVSPWRSSIHGDGIGQYGCTFGYGETPEEALAACIASALAHREAKGMRAPTGEVEFAA